MCLIKTERTSSKPFVAVRVNSFSVKNKLAAYDAGTWLLVFANSQFR